MEPKPRKMYVNLISQNVRGLIVSGRRMSKAAFTPDEQTK
jgi:hypothetical protein